MKTGHAAIDKEKPFFRDAAVVLFLTSIFAVLAASSCVLESTARISAEILDLTGIEAEYLSRKSLMRIRLIDGSVVDFPVTMRCSGLIPLLIFSFVSVFTVGLLKGALVTKLSWFILGISLGYAWKIGQLASVMAIAHSFGLDAFTFARYVLAPSTDFVWIVSLWALGMSWLKREGPS